MKILIAPDKFKGALNAREVAENIAKGLLDVLPDVHIEIVPMADGGEGTAEAICSARGCSWLQCKAHDPLGRDIYARYGWIANDKLAVMEMSEAAGIKRLQTGELNPEIATTFGVGEMILDASRQGADQIIIGLGGSATNDGGFGMARALGFRFFGQPNADELDCFKQSSLRGPDHPLEEAVSELVALVWIRRPVQLTLPKIIAAVDVRNPLLRQNGATQVFGPQKGASKDQLDILERALTRLADVVAKGFGFDYRNEPGAGAAGGLGFGLMSFCGAKIRPGFDVVAEAVGLEAKIRGADIVITGEGSLDRQTLEGKTPVGVARLARKFGKRVFAIVGRAANDPEVRGIFDAVYQNARPGMSQQENMKRAAELLRENALQLADGLGKRRTIEGV